MRFIASALIVLTCSPAFAAGQISPAFAGGTAAQAPPKTGVIQGVVTTQAGTVRLPGAEVIVKDSADKQAAQLLSQEDGHFSVVGLPPGKYNVIAALPGFVTTTVNVDVAIGRSTDAALDLPIGGISQSVEVVAKNPVVSDEGTLAPTEAIKGKELEQFAPSGGLQASLRLLASIIEVPGGVSIKGGRPSQAGVQLGPGTIVDPSTGLSKVSLPDDAVESVSVLANPYAVEFGRFSSGLVIIQTRRAGDRWKVRLNDIDPTFRVKRGTVVSALGVGWWAPRVEAGGPLVKDRLFIQQAAQFRYAATDVPSLPQNLLVTSKSFSSFSRVDANLSARHTLVATGGLFPGVTDNDMLGTFTPPDATVRLKVRANEVAFTERALWTDTLFGETAVSIHHYQADVLPKGTLPMQLLPETTLGNFFNQQHRDTDTYQVIESLSGTRMGLGGLHLFKFGIDVLRNEYDGSSLSRPVLIERSNGTLARRLDFPAAASLQSVHTTDVALFAQDRYQRNTRWYLEFGARLDRDGVVERFNVTPRVGTAVLLNQSGSAVLRGGFGLFYERTPSAAGAFAEFAGPIGTRYAGDGVTPVGPPVQFRHTSSDLETPRSRTWDIGYDHRLSKDWAIHVAAIDREGSHELIVNPIQASSTTGELHLSSDGHSYYRGLEVGAHFTRGSRVDATVTYTRSVAKADLNALTNYFDTILWPVVGQNAYAPANADVPHRLLARGRVFPTPKWLLIGTFDWRSGLPYSVVNDTLDFVGPRNSQRFPIWHRLEVGVERHLKIFKLEPWVGVRVRNALNSSLNTDVQSNLGSPAFGTFYNSEYRLYHIIVRFER